LLLMCTGLVQGYLTPSVNISHLIYMVKEKYMILNVHCHCSTLDTKYVMKAIGYTLKFRTSKKTSTKRKN
jgi:hypothetical protein